MTTTDAAQPMPPDGAGQGSAPGRRNSLGRTILIWVCIVLGCIGLIASVFAIWAHVLLFDTDQWVDTLGPLLEDPEVRAALSDRLSEQIVEALQIEQRARERLPDRAAFVAPAIAEASRDLLDRRLERFFSREGVQEAWVEAIRFVHETVVAILRDESTAIQTEDGKIVLNLMPLLGVALDEVQQVGLLPDRVTLPDLRGDSPQQGRQELEQALGVQLRPGFGTLPLAESDRLEQAQQYVRWFDRLVWILPILTLIFLAAAVFISRRRLRTALWLGVAVAVSSLIARLLVEFAEREIVDAIAATNPDGEAPVAAALLSSVTGGLRQVTAGLVVVGVVVAVLAFLAERLGWLEPSHPAQPAVVAPEPPPA